jgi:2-(3-amino-3-carboxypropyl)histidine synthase
LDNSFSFIGIVTTAQYLHYLPEIKKHLEKNKIKVEITSGKRVENGQVLGCNYSSTNGKAKTILYFGDGLFHPLGIHFGTKKEVIIFDPIIGTIKTLDEEKNSFLRKRFLLIEKAKEGKSFAILVSTKIGQNRISTAEKIKKELAHAGKKAFICSMDFISEEKLLGLDVDVLVNTACPRLSIDDFASYKKPLINYNEVKYVLGKSYEDYKTEIIY